MSHQLYDFHICHTFQEGSSLVDVFTNLACDGYSISLSQDSANLTKFHGISKVPELDKPNGYEC